MANEHSFNDLIRFIASIHRFYEDLKTDTLNADIDLIIKDNPSIVELSDKLSPRVNNTRTNYWNAWANIATAENRNVLVYDIGLTQEQKDEVSTWKSVKLIQYPFGSFPTYFKEMKLSLLKPTIMFMALKDYSNILFLDCSIELTNRINFVDTSILSDGYYFINNEINSNINNSLPLNLLKHFGLSERKIKNKVSFDSNVQGVTKYSNVYYGVLIPIIECAMSEECILTPGYDYETILSSLLHNSSIHSNKREEFTLNSNNAPHLDKIIKKKAKLIAVPFSESGLDLILENIEKWSTNYTYQVCHSPVNIDLMFFLDISPNKTIELEILSAIKRFTDSKSGFNHIHNCFRKVLFRYANVTLKEKPMDLNDQFKDLIFDPNIYENYEYMFFMNPKCYAIRPNWLNALNTVIENYKISKPNFWIIGSNIRDNSYIYNINILSDLSYRLRLNENAIYSLDQSHRAYIKFCLAMSKSYTEASMKYLISAESYDLSRVIWSRFVYHDVIMSWPEGEVKEKGLRSQFPRTYFVYHNKKMIV